VAAPPLQQLDERFGAPAALLVDLGGPLRVAERIGEEPLLEVSVRDVEGSFVKGSDQGNDIHVGEGVGDPYGTSLLANGVVTVFCGPKQVVQYAHGRIGKAVARDDGDVHVRA